MGKGAMMSDPLSSSQSQEVTRVKSAYLDFWKNIKFRKGWDAPLFTAEEVDSLLSHAAEIVVRIRSWLDAVHPGFQMRVVGGSSQEYLWDVDIHPLQRPNEFLNGLVHSTFKDAKGYVEGLTSAQVDEFISEFVKQNEAPRELSLQNEVSQLLPLFNQFGSLIQELFPSADITTASDGHAKALHILRAKYHLDIARRHLAAFKQIHISEQSECEMNETKPEATSPSRTELNVLNFSTDNLETETEVDSILRGEDESVSMSGDEKSDEKVDDVSIDATKAASISQSQESSTEAMEDGEPEALKMSVTGMKIDSVSERVEGLRPQIHSLESEIQDLKKLVTAESEPASFKAKATAMQKKCLQYSETLMQNLLHLDSIEGGSEESRIKRRGQAKAINELMDNIDHLKDSLRSLQDIIRADEQRMEEERKRKREEEEAEKKKKREEEEKKMQEEAKLEEAKKPQHSQHIEKDKQSQVEDKWIRLKLDAKMDVSQHPDKYVVSAYLPGLDEKQISVNVEDGNVISITGVRRPSPQEENQMRQALRQRCSYPKEREEEFLLRFASGRFGRFEEKFSLPANVDTSKIKASYERGVLQVFLPKKVAHHQPRRNYDYPSMYNPYQGYPFFSDEDAFW